MTVAHTTYRNIGACATAAKFGTKKSYLVGSRPRLTSTPNNLLPYLRAFSRNLSHWFQTESKPENILSMLRTLVRLGYVVFRYILLNYNI